MVEAQTQVGQTTFTTSQDRQTHNRAQLRVNAKGCGYPPSGKSSSWINIFNFLIFFFKFLINPKSIYWGLSQWIVLSGSKNLENWTQSSTVTSHSEMKQSNYRVFRFYFSSESALAITHLDKKKARKEVKQLYSISIPVTTSLMSGTTEITHININNDHLETWICPKGPQFVSPKGWGLANFTSVFNLLAQKLVPFWNSYFYVIVVQIHFHLCQREQPSWPSDRNLCRWCCPSWSPSWSWSPPGPASSSSTPSLYRGWSFRLTGQFPAFLAKKIEPITFFLFLYLVCQ